MNTAVRVTTFLVSWLCLSGLILPASAVETEPVDPLAGLHTDVTEGSLRVQKEDGSVVACPLKHTDVEAEIAGFIARVTVTQVFANPLEETIEAVYVFPLPHQAAVDAMTMVVGERRIVGVIKRRQAAREIYEDAVRRGATAALLEQERPNIFTQSVGNIRPGQEVEIEITYVDVLGYDMGVYAFHFPMVVGPRYIPGTPTSKVPEVPEELKGKVGELDKTKVREGPKEPTGTGWSPDTDRVPDASRITPPVLKPGMRSGRDIRLSVWLDAGVPIRDLKSPNHPVETVRDGPSRASVEIAPADAIPNKDFRLEYAVVGQKPEMAMLAHTDPAGSGYFMLMVQPKEDERLAKTPPRGLSFLIDVSGSMRGAKTAKVREAMGHLLKLAKPADTLQVITFAGSAAKVFPKAVACTEANVARALKVTEGLRGSGGTEMLKGVKMALGDPLDPKRVRIVIMLTDGFIGNEAEIIEEVGRRCGDHVRFWCIGIGQSPNRMLLDGVARQGGGMAKVLGLNDDALPLTREIMYRIHRAQLAGVTIDWGDLEVWETYPARIPELWAGRPIVLFGRYEPGSARDRIVVRGTVEGEAAAWPLEVHLPVREVRHDVLAKVWARRKIEELMHTTYYAGSPEVQEAVTQVALDYRLMSPYTSFVAVDESELGQLVEPAQPPRRMLVPVPVPEGAVFEGFFRLPEPESPTGKEGRFEGGDVVQSAAQAAGGGGAFGDLFGAVGGGSASQFRRPGAGRGPVGGGGAFGSLFGGGSEVVTSPRPAPRFEVGDVTQAATGVRTRDRWVREDVSREPSRLGKDHFYRGGAGRAPWNRAWNLAYEGTGEPADDADTQNNNPFAPDPDRRLRLAEKAARTARTLLAAGRLREAREVYAYTYLISEPRAGEGPATAAALEAVDTLDARLRKAWAETVPALGRRINLELCNTSIPDAVEAVAGEARVQIHLLPGSVDDAARLTHDASPGVAYLDLRHVMLADALDWLLAPRRMAWWVEDGRIVAGTTRRGPHPSPWIYDVTALAAPTAEELKGLANRAEQAKAMRAAVTGFLSAVRDVLGPEDVALWYAPGQVLVFASAKGHAAIDRLLVALADPDAKVDDALADLHRATSRRAAAHARASAECVRSHWIDKTRKVFESFAWPLLADAAEGTVNREAVCRLRAVLGRPEDRGEDGFIPNEALLRAAWAIDEAARALPESEDLARLAKKVRAPAREAAAGAVSRFEANGSGEVAAVYAVLLGREDAGLTDRMRRALKRHGKEDDVSLRVSPAVVEALILPVADVDCAALAEALAAETVRDDDGMVLTALACRRAGGAPWRRFRIVKPTLASEAGCSGHVVVLVNRLYRPRLKLVAHK